MSDALREALIVPSLVDRVSDALDWRHRNYDDLNRLLIDLQAALAAPPTTVNLQDIIEYLMEQKETGGDLTRQRAEALLDGLAELSESNHD